jgi:hypothetical protein
MTGVSSGYGRVDWRGWEERGREKLFVANPDFNPYHT